MAYEVILNRDNVHRILLEPRAEGCYVNVFQAPGDEYPFRDMLQDDLEMAMRDCQQDYGVSPEAWRVVPNEPIHFDSMEDQESQYRITRGCDGRAIGPDGQPIGTDGRGDPA